MAGMKIDSFGGMLPATSRRLLPDTAATDAVNTDFTTGEMRPLRLAQPLKVLYEEARRKAYRLPNPNVPSNPVWLQLYSPYGMMSRSPLVNDIHKRYIYIDNNSPSTQEDSVENKPSLSVSDAPALTDGTPAANPGDIAAGLPVGGAQFLWQTTLDRLGFDLRSYRLGVPKPALAPTLGVQGGSGTRLTRSYVYTFENLWGEEGPPSEPATTDGFLNGGWTIGALPNTADMTERGIVNIRVYRTVTGDDGNTTFYLVEQLGLGFNSYYDTRPDTEIVREGIVLQSLSWREPEAMEGFVAMPNGILAGWRDNQVFFSEPYRPWAWPPEYIIALRFQVVACAVTDNTLVVLTNGSPSFITGTTPISMTVADSPVIEPCITPMGVVATPEAVYYIGRNGMMSISPSGVSNVSAITIEPKDWRANYAVRLRGLAKFESALLVFQDNGDGFLLDGRDDRVALQRLLGWPPIDAIWVDPFTGDTHLSSKGIVYIWGRPESPYGTAFWRSKEFHMTKPVNFGAVCVNFETAAERVAISVIDATMSDGAVPIPTPGVPPIGGGVEPWWGLPDDAPTILRVYAGRKEVWSAVVDNDLVYRLPSGFKSDLWQFELTSRVPVYSIQVAETAKELANV